MLWQTAEKTVAFTCWRVDFEILSWKPPVSLLYAQLRPGLNLNDVCDDLSFVTARLQAICWAKAPARNTLFHANRQRDPELARRLCRLTLEHLQHLSPGFGGCHQRLHGYRFKRLIHLVDSTTITLVASCIDWARPRRRQAAVSRALCGWSVMPSCSALSWWPTLTTTTRAPPSSAPGSSRGDHQLRHVACPARPRQGLGHRRGREDRYHVRERRAVTGRILRDAIVKLTLRKTHRDYPAIVRRVVARVEVDGVEREMTFLTNQLDWVASSVGDLYRCRWQIEVFFKQIKGAAS
jgi:hypothetical protein